MSALDCVKLLAIQYSAAPPPAHSRAALTIRGCDAAEREQLHLYVSRSTKNLKTQSVDDPKAPVFEDQEQRSITLRRKQSEAGMHAINNSPKEMEDQRALHPGRVQQPPGCGWD